jgi:hypothetical protein
VRRGSGSTARAAEAEAGVMRRGRFSDFTTFTLSTAACRAARASQVNIVLSRYIGMDM